MESLWVSGNDHKVYQMDRTGSILDSFDVNLENDVNVEISALCIDQQKTLIFSLSWLQMYASMVKEIPVLRWCWTFRLAWIQSERSRSQDGDLLVSMHSSNDNHDQSRVVRLAENTEKKISQCDTQKEPLFSVGKTDRLHLTENGNGDICVADYAGGGGDPLS